MAGNMNSKTDRRKACKRMNNHYPSTKYRHDHATSSRNREETDESPISASVKNKVTRYDDDRYESKEILKQQCQDYQATCYGALKKRKLKKSSRCAFKALLGMKRHVSDVLVSSDLRARFKCGRLLIDETYDLFQRASYDPRLKVFWITFVDQQSIHSIRTGNINAARLKDKVSNAIRVHTSLNAIAVVENQVMVNYPKGDTGEAMCIHGHALCWSYDQHDARKLQAHAKGFKSQITKLPVHWSSVYHEEGSYSRLARYMMKPPYEGKEVNYEELESGKPCLYSARRVELYQHLRLFEYQAKTPLDKMIFGVREGGVMRRRLISALFAWHQGRAGTAVPLNGQIYPLFEAFLSENRRLANYNPMQVQW
jgi:hypothetical protein